MDDKRFSFGKNWSNYSKNISNDDLESSIIGLKNLLPKDFNPTNKSFIDIGCGSGIHTIAASKLGFKNITSTDYDQDSVNTTIKNINKFNLNNISVLKDDILNTNIKNTFDVVYSWGVLHHTGNMQTAIINASKLVNDKGIYIIAIYKKTRFCPIWKFIKKIYNINFLFKYILIMIYVPLITLISLLKNKKLNLKRGMKITYDAIDWLGGYPYESSTKEDILKSLNNYNLIKIINDDPPFLYGILGSGCAEYIFKKEN